MGTPHSDPKRLLKGGAGAIRRVFGPSLDKVADALARLTGWQLRNVGRGVDSADQKSIRKYRSVLDEIMTPSGATQ